ncbi:MAG: metalloregulator ArsR/SmtB family transcription factor [Terracidiphilus sp.]
MTRNRKVTDRANHNANSIFDALADPTRRSILEVLCRGGQPVGQIAEAFPVSRPAVSKHLGLLRRARLVHERREGRHRVYALDAEPLKVVDTWLNRYRAFWDASLQGLKAYLEEEGASGSSESATRRRTPRRR